MAGFPATSAVYFCVLYLTLKWCFYPSIIGREKYFYLHCLLEKGNKWTTFLIFAFKDSLSFYLREVWHSSISFPEQVSLMLILRTAKADANPACNAAPEDFNKDTIFSMTRTSLQPLYSFIRSVYLVDCILEDWVTFLFRNRLSFQFRIKREYVFIMLDKLEI